MFRYSRIPVQKRVDGYEIVYFTENDKNNYILKE